MGLPRKLEKTLEKNSFKYCHIYHRPSYTAIETAKKIHVPEKTMAKVVVAEVDHENVIFVLPATEKVDRALLHEGLLINDFRLLNEKEMHRLFPECETGAEAPFGNIYNLPVFLSDSYHKGEKICFNAGTHTDAILCNVEDFIDFVHPEISHFSDIKKMLPKE